MSYPVSFEVEYVEQRNRLTALFRLILVIPLAIWLWVYGILASVAIVIAWFAIVITGRYPPALFEFVAGFNRAVARVTAYAALLCDPYPPFSGAPDPAYPVGMDFAGPLEGYSRLKTFFRPLLVLANSYVARSDAYLFLLTETYPPFQDEQTRAAGAAI